MFKKIFSIALLSIAAIFGVFNLTPNVSAEELPEVGIKEVEVKIGDKEIIIFATLFNSSDSLTTTPFTYLAMLKSINHFIPSSDPDLDLPALIVSAVEGEEYTILNPLEEKRASYLIPISPDLPQDNYDLSLNLILKDGRSVGYYYDVLRDYGANEKSNKTSYTEGFLAFNQESCGVARADGLIFPANEGPVFKPLERPVANCKVRNIGDKDLTVYPVVIWKEFFVYGRPSSGQRYYEKLEQPIFIRAGETKNVEVLLPDEEVPQVYQALVSFEDAGGNKKSFDMFFRWTIKGESGRVNAVSLVDAPKESYTKGETLALSVDYYGSVDLYWRDLEENISQTANFNLTAIVKDKNGEICGQKTVKLPTIEDGGLKNEVVDVALSKDCNGVSYSVSLISEDGNVVAQEEDILPVRKNIAGNLMPYFYLLTVLMAFIIFVMVFAIRKKKKSITGVYLLAFVFAATCFFGIFSETEAATTKPYTGVPSPSGYSGEAFTANDTNNGESSDKLYSYYTGGNNEVKIKDVYAYFDDYFAYTNEVPYVHFDYGSGYGGSCSNSALYIRVKMELVVGNSTYKLDIKKRSSSDGYDGKYIKEIIGSAMSDRNLNLEINPDNFANIYDSNGKLKDNANLIIYVTAVSRHAQDSTTPEGSYYKSTFTTPTNKTQYSSRSDALDASDDMKITIPLSSLPNPSVTLDANPTEVDYGGSSKLTWTTKDVDSCAEFNTNNDSQFSGSITVMSSGSETIYNITKDNTYTLQCDKYLGSAVGKKNYLDTASVSVKPNPSCTASPSSTTTGSNVTFSSAVTGGTSPYTYSWSGTDISGTNTGSTLTKSYSTIGTKSATIKVTDKNNKIGEGTCTVSISSPDQCDSANNSCVSGSWSDLTDTSTKYKWKCGSLSCEASITTTPLEPPTGLTGSAGACGGNINLSWNSVTGATSYTLYRSGYEFSGINGTSYADSGLGTDMSHEYKVKACDSSGVCSPYSPSISVTSSGECPSDAYSLTFRTKGNGSGYAKFYDWRDYWQDGSFYDWVLMGDNLSELTDGEQATIGKDYKFKLTAMPAADSYFGGWSGCDDSSGDECFLNENTSGTSKTVTADFKKEGGPVSCDPTVKFGPNSDIMTSGNTRNIYWYSAYADSCVPSGGGKDTNWANSSIGTSGSYSVTEIKTSEGISRTYNITCYNSSGGSSSGSATITVSDSKNSPYFAFDAFPNPVTSGQSTNLYWIGTNCLSSRVSLFSPTDSSVGELYNTSSYIATLKGWYGSIADNGGYYSWGLSSSNTGDHATSDLSSDTTYVLRCETLEGTNSYAYQYLTVEAGVNSCGPSNVPPEVSLVCDPVSCEGYYGSVAGQDGSLKVTYAATDVDDNIDSCEFEVDGNLESSSCNDNYYPTSVLSAGTHTVAMTATDKDGEAAVGSKTVEILERKTVVFEFYPPTDDPPTDDPPTDDPPTELYATIIDVIDGLSVNSTSVTMMVSGTCENISLSTSAIVPSILGAEVKLTKNNDGTYNITVKSIPGITATGTYNITVKGTGTNCAETTVYIPLNVKNITTRWEEV